MNLRTKILLTIPSIISIVNFGFFISVGNYPEKYGVSYEALMGALFVIGGLQLCFASIYLYRLKGLNSKLKGYWLGSFILFATPAILYFVWFAYEKLKIKAAGINIDKIPFVFVSDNGEGTGGIIKLVLHQKGSCWYYLQSVDEWRRQQFIEIPSASFLSENTALNDLADLKEGWFAYRKWKTSAWIYKEISDLKDLE